MSGTCPVLPVDSNVVVVVLLVLAALVLLWRWSRGRNKTIHTD